VGQAQQVDISIRAGAVQNPEEGVENSACELGIHILGACVRAASGAESTYRVPVLGAISSRRGRTLAREVSSLHVRAGG